MKEAKFKESRKEVINKASSLFRDRMALATEHVLQGAKVNLQSLLFHQQIIQKVSDFYCKQGQTSVFKLIMGRRRKNVESLTLQSELVLKHSLSMFESKQTHESIKRNPLPELKTIEDFLLKMLHRMKLANEVAICALIFIETLVVSSGSISLSQEEGEVQILWFNWRPIVFTAFLLATKYWEDIA